MLYNDILYNNSMICIILFIIIKKLGFMIINIEIN